MSERRVFTVGRHPSCHIVLADEEVSREHAHIIFCEGGKIQISDNKSTNGTYILKGEEFKKVQRPSYISPTDMVRFGPCEMAVKDLLEYLRLIPEPDLDKPPKPKKTKVEGVKLVRCVCGHVKEPGQPCPGCGEETIYYDD